MNRTRSIRLGTNPLHEARTNPDDLRIAELFDEDELATIADFNIEPVMAEREGGPGMEQVFIIRFSFINRDGSKRCPSRPLALSKKMFLELVEAIHSFDGFGE